MSDPATPLQAGGLSDATGASVSVVMDSIGGALAGTLSVVAVPLVLGATVLAVVVLFFLGRKVRAELREHKRQNDPRDGFDPDAPDLLGVW